VQAFALSPLHEQAKVLGINAINIAHIAIQKIFFITKTPNKYSF
jgi:hypothetical protein